MKSALYTLELLADTLCGSAGAIASDVVEDNQSDIRSKSSSSRPALGLRLLDLPPAVLEAPTGQAFGTLRSSRVSFRGKGKALVFELPELFLQQEEPVPLWLMALAMQPDSASAVLVASACVDLRQEVTRAAAVFKQCSGTLATGNTFRRCSFRMTAVRDGNCDLTLDCFLRLYAGGHQPLTGNELLLQPVAVAPSVTIEETYKRASVPRPAVTDTPLLKDCRTTETQTEAFSDPAPPDNLQSCSNMQIQQGTLPADADDVFFGNEIHLKSSLGVYSRPEPLSEISVSKGHDHTPQGPACPAGDAIHESSEEALALEPKATIQVPAEDSCSAQGSLPLVSELVRELWQMRNES